MKNSIADFPVRFVALLICLFSWSPFSVASNFHEHLQYLPLAEDFRPLLYEMMDEKSEAIMMKDLWGYTPDPASFMYEIGLGRYGDLKGMMGQLNLESLTFAQLIRELTKINGRTWAANFYKFLRVPRNKLTTKKIVDVYLSAGTMRRTLIDNGSHEAVIATYNNYLDRERLINRRHLWASLAAGHFFSEEQLKKVQDLKALFIHRGTTPRYYLSVGRTSFLKRGMKFWEIAMRELTGTPGNRTLDGIDIVGSIVEDSPRMFENQLTPEEIKNKFTELFEFAQRHELDVRLHTFEQKSEGPFYDGLKMAIEAWRGPKMRLEIGHIAYISDAWIEYFDFNRDKFNFEFNVNKRSNEVLLGLETEQIAAVVQKLRAKAFPVWVGSDGRGILGNSSKFTNQVRDLYNETGLWWTSFHNACEMVF